MKTWNGCKERFGSDTMIQTITFKQGSSHTNKIWGDIKDVSYRRLMRLAVKSDFYVRNMPTAKAIMKLMHFFNGDSGANRTNNGVKSSLSHSFIGKELGKHTADACISNKLTSKTTEVK